MWRLALLPVAASVLQAQPVINSLIELGTLTDSTTAYGHGVSQSGFIVGTGQTSSGTSVHAFFRLLNGTIQDLGTLGGSNSTAYAVNDSQIAVGAAQNASGHYRAFIDDALGMTDLGTLGGNESVAYALQVGPTPSIVGAARTVQAIIALSRPLPVCQCPCSISAHWAGRRASPMA